MRRPRDVAIRAGFYLAATLTGLAAAYVLKEWIYHIWDTRTPRIDIPPADEPELDTHTSEQSGHTDSDPPAPVSDPASAPQSHLDTDVQSPPTLPKMLPPLRVNSLPPPIPGSLSGSFYSVNPDSLTSPTTPFHMSGPEEGLDTETSSQTTGSDSDSFVDVLSPHPPAQVISRRRSFFRNHDLFAESHMSFSQLGSLVAPENDSESK